MRQSTQEPGVLAMLGGALRDGAIFAIKHPGKALTMMLAIQSRAVAAQQNHSSLAWAQPTCSGVSQAPGEFTKILSAEHDHESYVDTCIDTRWNSTTGDMQMNSDYLDEAKENGARGVRLAFIVSQNGCKPSWGGSYDDLAGFIAPIVDRDLDVVASFGGAAGTYLESVCDENELVGAIEQVIKAIPAERLKGLDFDIEGAAVQDKAAVTRLGHALAKIQATYPDLTLSATLSVLTTGLTPDGMNVLTTLRDAGVSGLNLNIMAMDYGHPIDDMGKANADAYANSVAQFAGVFKLDKITAEKRVMITPMIGENDTANEICTIDHAKQLAANLSSWVKTSMWSQGRDRQCPSTEMAKAEEARPALSLN